MRGAALHEGEHLGVISTVSVVRSASHRVMAEEGPPLSLSWPLAAAFSRLHWLVHRAGLARINCFAVNERIKKKNPKASASAM